MRIVIEGKAFVQAGGIFVRHRLSSEVNTVQALGAILAETLLKALGGDFSLLKSGPSKYPIATVVVDLSALTDAQDSLKAQVTEQSANEMHTSGMLPRPLTLPQKAATANPLPPNPSKN